MNKDLTSIPNIGPRIAAKLNDIGIKTVDDLKGKDPEKLYNQNTVKYGHPLDRCVLYVYRSAVYFVDHKKHDPEKLKWWNWKDKR
jgi:hypothetical protein